MNEQSFNDSIKKTMREKENNLKFTVLKIIIDTKFDLNIMISNFADDSPPIPHINSINIINYYNLIDYEDFN